MGILILSTFFLSANSQSTDNIYGGAENGIVGKIADEYRVTPNGQFCYDIPIATVSGTGGMTPKLSISYNSGNGNGLFGYGFDLKGLSTITRAPRNLYNDNQADVVRFTDADRFSLDGSRLQIVKTTSTSTSIEYRTESNSFSKIIATGSTSNPSKFTVYTKDGLICEYEPVGGLATKNLQWPLTKVSDTKGNYYTIAYSDDALANEFVPSKIEYTGNSKASLTPFASITFSTKSISRTPTYISGVKILRSKVISSISIKYGDETVKEYAISYSSKKGKSFLDKITEKAGTEQLNSTTFKWDNNDSYSVSPKTFTNAEVQNVSAITGDFNGDGKKDFITRANNNKMNYNFNVFISNGSDFNKPTPWNYSIPSTGSSAVRICEIVTGDFNGDGYDDIVVERSYSPFYYLDYWEAQVASDGKTVSFVYKKTIGAPYEFDHALYVMDANCDGASDLFVVNQNYATNTYYTLMSSSTDDTITPLNLTASGELSDDCWDYPGCISLIDLDGDGTNEILNDKEEKINGCGSILYRMTKSGMLEKVTGTSLGGDDYFLTGDFNGDGKTDIITTGNKDKTEWEVNFATGVVGGNNMFESYTLSSYFNQKDKTAYAVDINGDGFDDIYVIDKNNTASLDIYINDGTGKNFIKSTSESVPSTKDRVYTLADFNGDGKTDLMSYAKLRDSTVGFKIYSISNTSSDLLSNITDGLGNETKIQYGRLTDKNVFTRGTNHTYPLVSIGNSWPVVSRVTTPSGQYGLHTVDYKYSNALYHKRGRGMLGFETFTTIDNLTNIKTISNYEILNSVMMPALKSVNTYNNNVLVQNVTYSNSVSFQNNSTSKSEWVFTCTPYKEIKKTYEYTSQSQVSDITTTNEYDDYGNVKVNTIVNGDKTTKTVNTYSNTENNWLLGRLKNSVVTKSNGSESVTISSEYDYDSTSGLLVKEAFASGNTLGYVKTYDYDLFGNIKKDTKTPNDGSQPRVQTTEYTNDGRFKHISIDCLGNKTVSEVDAKLGVETSNTDINDLSTTYTYNNFGEPKEYSNVLGKSNTVTAWSNGHAYAPANALYYVKKEATGKPTLWEFFDRLGQSLRKVTVAHNPNQLIFIDSRYDAKGQLIAISDPYYKGSSVILWNTKKYDEANRIIENINSSNSITKFEYSGLTSTVIDPNGNYTHKKVNQFGELLESTDAAGSSVTYQYDINGNCIETNGPRTTIKTEYDNFGNRTKLIDPDLGTVTYKYDAYGNLTGKTDPNGSTEYTYDVVGRLIKEVRPDFTYDFVYDTKWKGSLSSKSCDNSTSTEYFTMSMVVKYKRRKAS